MADIGFDAARHVVRLPESFTTPQAYIAALSAFIKESSWLLDKFHAVDFFVDDFWNQTFPSEWHVLADDGQCSMQELLELASYGRVRSSWPASLLSFFERIRSLELPRDPSDPWLTSMVANLPPLDTRILYGMSPKKRLEVQSLASVINSLAVSNGVTGIIDMGAGQGYLDACLAFTYGHTVIGVDDNLIQTCGAKSKSARIEVAMVNQHKRRVDAGEEVAGGVGKVYHVNRRVERHETFESVLESIKDDANESEIAQVIKRMRRSPASDAGAAANGSSKKTRPSLAPSMLRQFIEGDAAVFCGVGCCYNRLTEEFAIDDQDAAVAAAKHNIADRQPVSDTQDPTVRDQNLSLGFSARMVACQATCRWADQSDSLDNFTKHFHRALLQVLIVENNLLPQAATTTNTATDGTYVTVGRLGRGAFGHGFVNYAAHAFKRLGIAYPSPTLTPAVLQSYVDTYAQREKQIAVVWTMRSMLAGVIESLLLMDRFLFLVEKRPQMEVRLVPVFDHVDSPRNMAVVAVKPRPQ
ncbi:hypothetical protein BC831DRAFT_456229 [Entophlyctis helioformis]|nr:hypothetical protein BC831DRAFT_456229 [Entophlyctis helioformis]